MWPVFEGHKKSIYSFDNGAF